MKLHALLSGVILATAFTAASALTVQEGNIPQIDSNLVRNPCGLAPSTGTGMMVKGCLNDDHTAIVDLTSDEVISISGGQATLTAADDAFSRLMVSLVSLGTLILDIDANVDGFVTFTDGAGTSTPFALDGDGENFFTITGIVGNSVLFITTLTSGGAEADIVQEVKQIRLGIAAAIPEPETYALMMAGLAALGFIARRRKGRK